jgi:hypothetical protein
MTEIVTAVGIFFSIIFLESCFRRVLDTMMDRSALPGADRSTVWLAGLIEPTEVVATPLKHVTRHSESVQRSFGHARRCETAFDLVQMNTVG